MLRQLRDFRLNLVFEPLGDIWIIVSPQISRATSLARALLHNQDPYRTLRFGVRTHTKSVNRKCPVHRRPEWWPHQTTDPYN